MTGAANFCGVSGESYQFERMGMDQDWARIAGVVLFAAPEGTRSRDGRVRRFHDGAFRLAIEAGVPVLPIAIDGTANALPRRGWMFWPVQCTLHILEPFETAGLTPDQAPELRERVREAIVARVAGWRGVAPEDVDGAPERVEEGTNSPAGGAAGRALG